MYLFRWTGISIKVLLFNFGWFSTRVLWPHCWILKVWGLPPTMLPPSDYLICTWVSVTVCVLPSKTTFHPQITLLEVFSHVEEKSVFSSSSPISPFFTLGTSKEQLTVISLQESRRELMDCPGLLTLFFWIATCNRKVFWVFLVSLHLNWLVYMWTLDLIWANRCASLKLLKLDLKMRDSFQ